MSEARLSGLVARLGARGLLAAEPLAAHDRETDPVVEAIRYDSRAVRVGDVFVARRGQHADGHDHAAAAVRDGAVAVIVERPVPGIGVPEVLVCDARAALAAAASWRAGDPSQQLGIVGITGTDGKTTTAYLVRAILEASGRRTGFIGTTDVIVAGTSLGNAARASTPEAPELQGHLASMLAGGDEWAIVEATSHGLAQHRIGDVAFDVGVLTNITSEHLEFHGTLEAYRRAKQGLFERLASNEGNPEKGWGKHAVINADDEQGETVAGIARGAGAAVLRYGTTDRPGRAGQREPDITARYRDERPAGLFVEMAAPGWHGELTLRLAGRFNIHNALAALGVAASLGLDLDTAAQAMSAVGSVPGRMQRIDEGQPFGLVIDYAHTAEALSKVLDELAPEDPSAGLIAVFGSAGQRDVSKREAMGRVAGERCRLVVLTDEDPRGEDRMAILEDIAAGAENAGLRRGRDFLLIPDRAEAIATAVARARPGDTVLLAGKGHETTIETADGEVPWDEAAAARQALRLRQD